MTDGRMKDAATAEAEDDYATMLAAEGDGLLGDVEWDEISGSSINPMEKR